MKNATKRIFSLLLAFVMVLSVVPMNHAHATENEPVAKSEVFAGDDIVTIIPDAAPEGAEGEAVELPDFSFAYYNKANMLCIQQDFKAAITYYTQAIATDSDFAEAYFNRGLTYIYIGENDKGIADLSKAENFENLSVIVLFDCFFCLNEDTAECQRQTYEYC